MIIQINTPAATFSDSFIRYEYIMKSENDNNHMIHSYDASATSGLRAWPTVYIYIKRFTFVWNELYLIYFSVTMCYTIITVHGNVLEISVSEYFKTASLVCMQPQLKVEFYNRRCYHRLMRMSVCSYYILMQLYNKTQYILQIVISKIISTNFLIQTQTPSK